MADLESKFDDTVCGVLLETVQGEGGIYPVSRVILESRPGNWQREHGALLIADEIQCGLGRTGRYFALPAILFQTGHRGDCQAARGRTCRWARFSPAMRWPAHISPGLHGTTFGGGPLICAAALEFLQIVEDEKLMENVRARGEELRAGLQALAAKFDFIREVRAEGLMIGVQLSVEGAPFVAEAAKRGLLINCTHEYIIRLLPRFIVTQRAGARVPEVI